MTSEELNEEMKLIGVDDLDDKTKRELLVNGSHECEEENCPFCTKGPMQ